MSERVIEVPTPSKSYRVHVGRGLLDQVGQITRDVLGDVACCIVADDNVAPFYADRVYSSCVAARLDCSVITFPAGERSKNLKTLGEILERLAKAELTRGDCVIALGGGVTGDMAGLAAALYLRGCHVVQVPTSLLAMVDSSVGGKTAVDLEAGKNLVGAFFQPEAVVADVDTLLTLSHEQLTDSCGEVIKHGVLADADLFASIASEPINEPGYELDRMADVIARNVEIKRDVVVADERESGIRQTLNLGHTFGHAIEAASDYALGHGSSVAAGLCCMARASAAKGWCPPKVPRLIESCVAAYGLPCDTVADHDELMGYLAHDKKRRSDGYTIVVPKQIGEVELRRVSPSEIRELIDLGCGTYRRQPSKF
jgi:3-dehydroquinate synthase